MSFIDEIKIYVKSGNGGDGASTFRREKFIEFGGPDGGNGGNGGSVIFYSTKNKNTLLHMRYKQHIVAKNGSCGRKRRKFGSSAEDELIPLPIGTQIFDEYDNLIGDLDKENKKIIIVKGGKGGAGNFCLKNSKNQSPKNAIQGKKGEEKYIKLKIKMMADVGIVGMPNVGKSTFLSYCTNAKPKIANYPFTTLSPNIGMVQVNDLDFIIADIPGIIEGANEGFGLGKKFLKHIERCNIFIHIIDASSKNPIENYIKVNNELSIYGINLVKKDIILVLSKIDLINEKDLEKIIFEFKNVVNSKIYTLSYEKGKMEILNLVHNFLYNEKSDEQYIYDPR